MYSSFGFIYEAYTCSILCSNCVHQECILSRSVYYPGVCANQECVLTRPECVLTRTVCTILQECVLSRSVC